MKKKFILVALCLTICSIAFAQNNKVTNVTLAPPPKVDTTGLASNMNNIFSDGMAGIMNSMGPMYSNMAKSLMDAQIAYYKQPGKLIEIAKLNKQYFDALVKVGFTEDQSIKIITADNLLPKANGVKL